VAQRNFQRLAPLTGVLFVVLTVVSFLIEGEPPDVDDPAREVVEFYSDNEGQTIAAALVAALGAVALLFFAASLRRAIRRNEEGAGVLSVAALAGGIVAATGIATDSALRFMLADAADEKSIDPAALQALNVFWSDFFFPMVVGLATLILATGLAALRTRVVPTWLAWVGFVIFVVFFTPAGFVAFLVSALWIVIVSAILWRREMASSVAPAGSKAV
jgi:hypothetical protein